jgi:hypothetical protein
MNSTSRRSSARNSMANKCFLVGGQMYDHLVQPIPARRARQGRMPGHFAEKCVMRSISGREGVHVQSMRFTHWVTHMQKCRDNLL